MTTNNYTDLREKAEAASIGDWHLEVDLNDLFEETGDAEFIAAANPSTILALIADLQTANDKATELQERVDKALATVNEWDSRFGAESRIENVMGEQVISVRHIVEVLIPALTPKEGTDHE